MVSMKDIADRLKVSKSTVSLVLSGKAGGHVSESVKRDVLRVAREMNYHVNGVARSLRTGSSQLISVIVTDISNEFFGRLTFHIQEEAKKKGYLVLTINSNESTREFEDMVTMLMSKQVDGIIAVPTPGGEAAVQRIIDQGVPVVTVDRLCEGLDVDYVGVDNYAASLSAMDELLSDGFRKVSMVRLDLDIPPLEERERGYLDSMRKRGLEAGAKVLRVRFGDDDESGIGEAMAVARDCEAVFFSSHRVFTQAMTWMSHNGGIPRGQCLLCFDDVSPYMTGASDIRFIDQPVAEMARKAFRLLMRQITGEKALHRQYIFPTKCISGKSYL